MNGFSGVLLIIIGVVQISVDSEWFCVSMLWSAGGFCAGVGVGYLIRLLQERLGKVRHDDT